MSRGRLLVEMALDARGLSTGSVSIDVEPFPHSAEDVNLEDIQVLQTCELDGTIVGDVPSDVFPSSPLYFVEQNEVEDADNDYNNQDFTPSASTDQDGSDSVHTINFDSCDDGSTETVSLSRTRRRKHLAKSKNLNDEKNKHLREQGKDYRGWSRPRHGKAQRNVKRDGRKLGPLCSSIACRKSSLRHCHEFNDEHRGKLFKTFWTDMSWDQKKVYITSLIRYLSTATTSNAESRRKATFQYFLPTDNNSQKLQVCKKTFLNTFGLKESMVLTWMKKSCNGMVTSQAVLNERRRSRSLGVNEQTALRDQQLNQFLDSLPKLPSHYCRQNNTKVFVEPVFGSNTMSGIYREYQNWCGENYPEQKPYSIATFSKAASSRNIGFQLPKKDQCDECCAFQTGNLTEEIYNAHIARKEAARREKNEDKAKGANGECIVLTQDLQAVKVCPMLNASALYYKTKLCCHNFTIYDINSQKCKCYWFTEVDADLNASTFASFIIDYLTEIAEANKPIIIWSDSCGYQNKNAVLSNALLSFSVEKNVIIEQKFLEKGHTQMEADSVHATIERRLKNRPIYVPHNYVELTAAARQNPFPYNVKKVSFDFVKNFDDGLVYNSIRPGRKAGDPTVNDIRVIRYSPDGNITVKLDFGGNFIELPVRKKKQSVVKRISDFKTSRTEPIRVKHQKWVHLQQLKSVIPTDYHGFYDNLPHEED